MIDIILFALVLLIAFGLLYVILNTVMPTVCLFAGNYAGALGWLWRYFRHDMALYSPFDLVYLYIETGQTDQVAEVYRKYQNKGNIGSEYFVEAWVAAHQDDWQEAEKALEELRKYTIMNDVNLEKFAEAIAHKDAEAVDAIYLIDMNGRATVQPTLFRLIWSLLAGMLAAICVVALTMYLVVYVLNLPFVG